MFFIGTDQKAVLAMYVRYVLIVTFCSLLSMLSIQLAQEKVLVVDGNQRKTEEPLASWHTHGQNTSLSSLYFFACHFYVGMIVI